MDKYYKLYRHITNSKKEINNPTIGLELKKFIKARYVSAKRFARLVGVSESLITLIIKGKRRIPPQMKEKLLNDGFNEALIYNYITTDKIDYDMDTMNVIIGLKAIIDRQKNLLEFYERAITELRHDLDNLRKSRLTEINNTVNNGE